MGIGLISDTRLIALLREHQWLMQQAAIRPQDRPLPVPPEAGIRFQNTGTTTIPAFGLARRDATVMMDEFPIATAKYPDTTFSDEWLLNGPDDVPKNEFGTAQVGPEVIFAYDTGTPVTKTTYGPAPGQGTASVGYPPLLRVIGIVDSSRKLARGFWLGPMITQAYVKATGTTSANTETGTSSATAYQILAGSGSIWSDAGFTTVLAAFNRGTALAANDPAWLSWAGYWFIGKIC